MHLLVALEKHRSEGVGRGGPVRAISSSHFSSESKVWPSLAVPDRERRNDWESGNGSLTDMR